MQMYGTANGKPDQVIEAAVFSDHFVELNKPYYVAASVRMARDGKPGAVTFHLKDLSNDDQPLDSRTVIIRYRPSRPLNQHLRSQLAWPARTACLMV